METLETGEHNFVQYLINKRLFVDYETLTSICGLKSKTEMYRLLNKLGEENFEFILYKNRKLFPTENAINFFKIYREIRFGHLK